MFSSRNSQRGFSLVELMVVVAIIGVLASIAVPAVNKYLAKARQSEAKTNLSSLYTSEKAFYAEYTAYHSMFGAVGFSPEGKLRYNVGFSTSTGDAGAANGYQNQPVAPGNVRNTMAYCTQTGTIGATGCTILRGATNALPGALPGTATVTAPATGSTFRAEALAVIHTNGGNDQWFIDHNKDLQNYRNGIP
ncbi:prepilin-type N-terminal cleavage/methylation domain-containing protein [Bdellovibrio sp. 22V]|uniref:type IV pilin protein n=1 Tax=Bdellovibrio sp. 22V TaxID=3044166 RepID=UPI00254351A6|nr:prepilin-type N-terminal cleavage/methylation domain-containing protein [Bdellovibrio sp. 22V]WII71409.1 prepilin-type N-terminal cleavage/methylation domain-containing protein [Bdellovibrio sp. 22V]